MLRLELPGIDPERTISDTLQDKERRKGRLISRRNNLIFGNDTFFIAMNNSRHAYGFNARDLAAVMYILRASM